MNSLRKIVGFLMVLVLAVFALPSMADSVTKTFNATFPPVIANGGPQQIAVKFFNTTPGVATINSIQVFPAPNIAFAKTATLPYVTPGTGALQLDGSLIITNFTGIKSQKNQVFTFTVNVTATSCANELWPKPSANAGNSLNGDVFGWNGTNTQLTSAVGCDGTLACQDPNAPPDPLATVSDTAVTVTRGPNKDGTACSSVGFDLTDFIVTTQPDNKVSFQWDSSLQPNASFISTVHWNPQYVDPGTGLPKPTRVAYDLVNFVPLIACLGPNFPALYGTLNAFTASTITIDTTNHVASLPAAPFPFVIGTERGSAISLASTSGNLVTYNVQMPQGGTSPFPLSNGLPVMSTSLPLDASGNQQRACLINQDNTVVTSSDTPNCSSLINPNAPNPPPACVKVDSLILFEGDPAFTND
jgi:hypothetical protein